MSLSEEPLTEDPALASLLRRVAKAPAQPRAAFLTEAALRPGTAIDGRYVIEGVLGSGGMGVVYRAEHRQLKRKIALKLTRSGDARDNARMLREARAIAAVDHEHVVTIHDVGMAHEQVFIAMDLLDGGTARTWIGERVRTISEVVTLYRAAGAGLAAAHAHLLVHRDFKPDNVLVGRDGRVCVADFGLAQSGVEDSPEVATTPRKAPVSVCSSAVTAGTPAYMAPEVRGRRPATAQSDQYSFCMSLREALLGSSRPIPLHRAIWPDDARAIPRWLRAVVERGLSEDPQARFATMDALGVALRGPSRRWGWIAVVAAAAGLVALEPGVEAPCGATQQALDGVWDRDVRRELATAFERATVPGAAVTWRRVEPKLEHWATQWIDARREVCEASAGAEPNTVDVRADCLQHQRQILDATLSALQVADLDVVTRADEVVGALPEVSACTDEAALAGRGAIPTPYRARAQEIRSVLAVAAAHERVSKLDTAEALASDALSSARALGIPVLVAEACYGLGDVLRTARRWEEARVVAAEGLDAANNAQDDILAARLALMRAMAAVYVPDGEFEAALRDAEALVTRAGADARLQTSLLYAQALAARSVGRHDEAIVDLRAILVSTDDPVRAALVRSTLAETLRRGSRFEEALATYEDNIARMESTLGPDHRLVAQDLNNIGALELQREGDLAVARSQLERALTIREALFGADAPSTAETLLNLGQVMTRLGEHDRAETLLTQAEAGFASSTNGLSYLLAAQADLAKAQGDLDRAFERLRARLEHLDRHYPPGHVLRLHARYNLAASEFDRGADERARRIVDAALDELASQGADPSLVLANLLALSGNIAYAAGEHGRAVVDFAAAVAIFDTMPEAPATFVAEAFENGGRLLLDLGQRETGVAWLHRTIELIGDSDPERRATLQEIVASY